MKIDIFTLCDSAQEYGGKLVIVGTFNTISASSFPVVHPELAVVARICFLSSEGGIHNMEISIKSEDGKKVLLPPVKASVDNSKQKEGSLMNILVKGNNINLETPGLYKAFLTVDDQVFDTDLFVKEQVKE